MGQKRAELIEVRPESFTFRVECLTKEPRYFRVPFGVLLKSRFGRRDRVVSRVYGSGHFARVAFADGGRKTELASLAYDYDLAQHQLEGAPPLPERAEPREEHVEDVAIADTIPPPPPSEPVEEPGPALATLSFDGDALEVVELDGTGWVSLPSLLRPFGKRVNATKGLLEGWALIRTGRVGTKGGIQDVTLVHASNVPLVIARLDGRGMDLDTKAKHARYLQHVDGVLADHFGVPRWRGAAAHPRTVAPGLDPVLAELLRGQQAIAGQLAGRVVEVDSKIERVAEEVALLRRELSGNPGRLPAAHAAPALPMPDPGRARRVVEGAVVADPPPGFVSMREVARRFGLPTSGEGSRIVSVVADQLELDAVEGATAMCDVVIGGDVKRAQRRFGPEAVRRLRLPLTAAARTMEALGYTAAAGRLRATERARRAKGYVLGQMLDAAAAAVTPPRAEPPRQTTIPGTEVH